MNDRQTVLCPIAGKLDLDRVKETVFSSGALCKGCAIEPYEGRLYAPFSGKVETLSDTNHAISLVSDGGVKLLIRIGQDSVTSAENYFSAYCKAGDPVKEGELLIEFDFDAIKKAGCDTVTSVILVNSDRYECADVAEEGKISVGDRLLDLIDKTADADQKT